MESAIEPPTSYTSCSNNERLSSIRQQPKQHVSSEREGASSYAAWTRPCCMPGVGKDTSTHDFVTNNSNYVGLQQLNYLFSSSRPGAHIRLNNMHFEQSE